jgi:hypothetical protein
MTARLTLARISSFSLAAMRSRAPKPYKPGGTRTANADWAKRSCGHRRYDLREDRAVHF